MPRTTDAVVEAIAQALDVWPAQRRAHVLQRWATHGVRLVDQPQNARHLADGRVEQRCVVCGAVWRGRPRGRPPATCSDEACKRIRQATLEARRKGIDWPAVAASLPDGQRPPERRERTGAP